MAYKICVMSETPSPLISLKRRRDAYGQLTFRAPVRMDCPYEDTFRNSVGEVSQDAKHIEVIVIRQVCWRKLIHDHTGVGAKEPGQDLVLPRTTTPEAAPRS